MKKMIRIPVLAGIIGIIFLISIGSGFGNKHFFDTTTKYTLKPIGSVTENEGNCAGFDIGAIYGNRDFDPHLFLKNDCAKDPGAVWIQSKGEVSCKTSTPGSGPWESPVCCRTWEAILKDYCEVSLKAKFVCDNTGPTGYIGCVCKR